MAYEPPVKRYSAIAQMWLEVNVTIRMLTRKYRYTCRILGSSVCENSLTVLNKR